MAPRCSARPYALALPRADRLYATTAEAEVDSDAFFPCFPLRDWRLARKTFRPADARHRFAYTVRTYIRRSQCRLAGPQALNCDLTRCAIKAARCHLRGPFAATFGPPTFKTAPQFVLVSLARAK